MRVKSKVLGLTIAAWWRRYWPRSVRRASRRGARRRPRRPWSKTMWPSRMPPGIQVVLTERDGPVFADATGHTLLQTGRTGVCASGAIGDYIRANPTCTDQRVTETGGFMEPYPPGLTVPNVDHRPTCVQVWPPLYADASAQARGRLDGDCARRRPKKLAVGLPRLGCVHARGSITAPGDVLAARPKPVRAAESGGRDAVGPALNVAAWLHAWPPRSAAACCGSTITALSSITADRDGPNEIQLHR